MADVNIVFLITFGQTLNSHECCTSLSFFVILSLAYVFVRVLWSSIHQDVS
jgi:hypothetical protein